MFTLVDDAALPFANTPLSPIKAAGVESAEESVTVFQELLTYILALELALSHHNAPLLGLLGSVADDVYSYVFSADKADPLYFIPSEKLGAPVPAMFVISFTLIVVMTETLKIHTINLWQQLSYQNH